MRSVFNLLAAGSERVLVSVYPQSGKFTADKYMKLGYALSEVGQQVIIIYFITSSDHSHWRRVHTPRERNEVFDSVLASGSIIGRDGTNLSLRNHADLEANLIPSCS